MCTPYARLLQCQLTRRGEEVVISGDSRRGRGSRPGCRHGRGSSSSSSWGRHRGWVPEGGGPGTRCGWRGGCPCPSPCRWLAVGRHAEAREGVVIDWQGTAKESKGEQRRMHERMENRDRQCLGDCRNDSDRARCNTLRRKRVQSQQAQAQARNSSAATLLDTCDYNRHMHMLDNIHDAHVHT